MLTADPVLTGLIFLFGLLVGSFLNVLIGRYQELESVVATRSHCPHCRKIIAWYDLVPLLSFVLLKAKCRYCREKISWQYPVVELLTALLALLLYAQFGFSWLALGYFVVFCLLLVVAVIDLRDYVVPDQFVLPAILVALPLVLLDPAKSMLHLPWGVLLAGGGLATIVLVSRGRWMGAGDIGLGVLLGLLSGLLGAMVGLVLAFVSGSLVALVCLALKQKHWGDKIPFGPFLVAATLVAALWGQELAMRYLLAVNYY